MNHRDACLKCTICISACPVYRSDGEFPGPKALGPEWHRMQAAGETVVMDHVEDCTFCQLCELACPVGVPIAHLIAQQKDVARAHQSPVVRLRDAILTHPEWVARAPRLSRTPSAVSRVLHLSTTSRRPRPRSAHPISISGGGKVRARIGLFVDCFDRGFDEETLVAAQALLGEWGYDVHLMPKASLCCGAAAYASGRIDQARQQGMAMRTAICENLEGLEVKALITLNATCDGTIDEEWATYLGIDPLPIPVIAFHQFALDQAPKAFWDTLETSPVWTHTTCRGRRHGDGSLGTLARVAKIPSQALDLECCGAAGSYAFKAEHEATAHRMASTAKPQVKNHSGELWVDSGTCAIHLEQVLGLSARHPAYWLYRRWQAGMGAGQTTTNPGDSRPGI